jgi:hypothetical protein
MGTAEIGGETLNGLGAPALEAAGLRMWVHGRQSPSAHDPDEGNRLSATIRCESDAVSVKSEDAIIRSSDIAQWRKGCRSLVQGKSALARLSLKKGVFEIVLRTTEDHERFHLHVAVVPGEGARAQSFEFDLFRNELEEMVRQCDAILANYPVRGESLPENAE